MIKDLRFRYVFFVLFFTLITSRFESVGQQFGSSTFSGDFETGFTQSHQDALSSASLEQYRLRNSRRIFQFESGAKFELHSAVELTEAGWLIDPGNYITQSELNPMVRFVFQLGPNNQLAVRSEIDPNSKLSAVKVLQPIQHTKKISASDLRQMSEQKRNFILANPDKFE